MHACIQHLSRLLVIACMPSNACLQVPRLRVARKRIAKETRKYGEAWRRETGRDTGGGMAEEGRKKRVKTNFRYLKDIQQKKNNIIQDVSILHTSFPPPSLLSLTNTQKNNLNKSWNSATVAVNSSTSELKGGKERVVTMTTLYYPE